MSSAMPSHPMKLYLRKFGHDYGLALMEHQRFLWGLFIFALIFSLIDQLHPLLWALVALTVTMTALDYRSWRRAYLTPANHQAP